MPTYLLIRNLFYHRCKGQLINNRNTHKTKCIPFTSCRNSLPVFKSTKIKSEPELRGTGDIQIGITLTRKYLRPTLDSHLECDKHTPCCSSPLILYLMRFWF